MAIPETPSTTRTAQVLSGVTGMIVQILDNYGVDEAEISMDTTFHDDLEMESIDLVTLAGMLASTYGDDVKLAEFLADKSLDEVIGLTIGDIVRYVVSTIERS